MAINPNTDFVAAAVLTADQMNRLPRGIMALSTLTSNGSILNGETTRTSVTFTAVANRYYRVSWYEPDLNNANAATNTFYLRLDNATTGTIIGTSIIYTLATASDNNLTSIVTTFSAGSRTIFARYFENAGTATNANASATKPAYLMVEDIGPA
jgi:hypothetical protein